MVWKHPPARFIRCSEGVEVEVDGRLAARFNSSRVSLPGKRLSRGKCERRSGQSRRLGSSEHLGEVDLLSGEHLLSGCFNTSRLCLKTTVSSGLHSHDFKIQNRGAWLDVWIDQFLYFDWWPVLSVYDSDYYKDLSLPDPPASSWPHRWQGSWSSRGECLHFLFSKSDCENRRAHELGGRFRRELVCNWVQFARCNNRGVIWEDCLAALSHNHSFIQLIQVAFSIFGWF